MEEWRDIEGYEGLYQVSNYGRVKSLKRYITLNGKNQHCIYHTKKVIKERIMKYGINSHGYCQVMLHNNGKKKNKSIHQLVAQAFIPNPDKKPTVNHINGDKLNNSVDNLEWATCKEQTNHLIHTLGHKSIITKQCRDKQKELHQRKVKRSDGIIFNSIKEASMGNDVLRRKISQVCKGKLKRAGGYSWEYI